MVLPHAKPGEVIDVSPLGLALPAHSTTTLVKTDDLEVMRIVLRAGESSGEHSPAGEAILHCLEGRVEVTLSDETRELAAGQLLYLSPSEQHTLRAIDDASLLLTLRLLHEEPRPAPHPPAAESAIDVIDEASEESFPASDSPSWTPVTRA